mmetsp:Transcript_99862/g.288377  ORF Transcript_99862/g.288377 Transcript_99862/m.288377 type:complete len:402 (+) Transcript_99862:157-1362(+)
MKSEGSRFLRRVETSSSVGEYWEEVDDDIAYQKVAHVFRNQKQRREGKRRAQQQKQEEDAGSSLSSYGAVGPSSPKGGKKSKGRKTGGQKSSSQPQGAPSIPPEMSPYQAEARVPNQAGVQSSTAPSNIWQPQLGLQGATSVGANMPQSGLPAGFGMNLLNNPGMASGGLALGSLPPQQYHQYPSAQPQPQPTQQQAPQGNPMVSALSALLASTNPSAALPPSIITIPNSSGSSAGNVPAPAPPPLAHQQQATMGGNSSANPPQQAANALPPDTNPQLSAFAGLLSSMQGPQNTATASSNPLMSFANNAINASANMPQQQQGNQIAILANLILTLLQQQQQPPQQPFPSQQQQVPMQQQSNMGDNNNTQLLMMVLQLLGAGGGAGVSGLAGSNNPSGGGGP